MKQSITTVIQLCLFITIMQQSFAQSEKFGRMIYTPPPGWKITKYQNSVELGIAPAPKELLLINILPAMNFPGTLEQALEKSYDETCAILQVTKMNETKIPFSTMMMQLRPYFIIFFISGFTMITGFFLILYPLLKNQTICYFTNLIKARKIKQGKIPGILT